MPDGSCGKRSDQTSGKIQLFIAMEKIRRAVEKVGVALISSVTALLRVALSR